MSPNKSSLEETPWSQKQTALRNAVAHYRRAALMLSHAETLDSLRRAEAAFGAAGARGAAERCAQLRREVEAGGRDDLPPVSELPG